MKVTLKFFDKRNVVSTCEYPEGMEVVEACVVTCLASDVPQTVEIRLYSEIEKPLIDSDIVDIFIMECIDESTYKCPYMKNEIAVFEIHETFIRLWIYD